MKIYEVGGAVRDRLLGLPVRDRDWVVVGASAAQMEALGFKPVGRDFPVFLHPETHEEYALARTERKVAPGYHGFRFHASPEVTLEEDLRRRDLTINAMACAEDGVLIDPCGGRADLEAGVLRHVSPAFAEDPVRILRLARFAARFGFVTAPETLALMRQMVEAGEVAALVPERVWQELAKGLSDAHPARFFHTLAECGALPVCLPGCEALAEPGHALEPALARAAELDLALAPRIAILVLGVPAIAGLGEHLRWPGPLTDLARLCVQQRDALLHTHWSVAQAEGLLALIEAADALRRPQRLEEALVAVACLLPEGRAAMATVLAALHAARAVNAGAIAAGVDDRAAIPLHVRAARLEAVRTLLAQRG